MPSQLTLFLLVDALRPDYLAHAPFLRELAAESATGFFREGFGFVPRQAYFGGLKTEQYGFTNMFCFDPEQSPFAAARFLGPDGVPGLGAEMRGGRRFVESLARERMTPFANSYANSAEIPFSCLPYFDVVEKRAPWDRKAGYRSIFHILDEQGVQWRQCIWPDTNRISDRSDAGIVRQILDDLGPEHRLACVHLQELDSLGHAFGPNSAKLQAGIAATDGQCRTLIEQLRDRYSGLKIVLFGDHGMVNVTRTLNLTPILRSTGLTFGVDYAYFLDSTMARFWFFHHAARAKVEQAFRTVDGGHMLDEDELERYGLARCDYRNGERFFLADPGILIFPNFFQASGEPIPGMHGYDPDCPDNLGFFLLNDSDRPEMAGSSMGKVDPHVLFPVLLQAMGLDPAAYTEVAPPVPVPTRTPAGRFTASGNADAESVVQGHVDRLLQAIGDRVGPVEAVVLTGSFGRGEGGVYRDEAGRHRPVNDYDVMVVDPRNLSAPLAGLGDELARELGIDFVDLGWSDGRWENLPLTIENYDLKYGSRVVSGDPSILDRIPPYASADLPAYEFTRLLLNRTAGLLASTEGFARRKPPPSAERRRFRTNQIVKALIAIGDWHLFLWRGYDSSYERRRQRFASLAPGAGVDPALAAKVVAAYRCKCSPDYGQFADGDAEIRSLHPALESALIHSIRILTEVRAGTLDGALSHYLDHMSSNPAEVRAGNERCRSHPSLRGLSTGVAASVPHAVCATLPLLLRAAVSERPDEPLRQARRRLEALFPDLPAPAAAADEWEALRERSVNAWFAACH